MQSSRAEGGRGALLLAALLVALAVPFPAGRGAAAAAVLIYPPDKALLTGDGSIQVLGYRAEAAPLSVTVTGKSGSRSVPVGTGSFTARVKLDPGENVLALAERRVTVFLVVAGQPSPAAGFSPADTHAVDNDCGECHVFSGGTAKLLEKPPALCQRCHDEVTKGKDGKPLAVLHPPAEEGDCLGCHGFHRLSIRSLTPAAKRDLCFGCHDDFTDGGKKMMHAPVAKGECTGCHGAHGAPGKKLLFAAGVKLCLLCHADPSQSAAGKALAVPHPALEDGCSSCHLPHVAAAPQLLKKPVADLCADCHDPFPEQQGGRPLVRHNPVEEGECASCHRVHGSELKGLLAVAGKGLCLKCHDDPSLAPDGTEWPTAHPALDDGCPTCHLPHVAPAAGLLKKDQAALCSDCHDAFVPPAAGAGGSIHRPVAQGACARCHAPHGSEAKKLLLASPNRDLCLTCHKDPTLAPGGGPWAEQHPALDDGCPTCHRPHVAAAPRLLAKPQRALCGGCHEDKNLNGEGEAWPVPHTPVAAGMCGSCHGVHGGPEKALLRKSAYEICDTCHTEVHQRHRGAEIDPATGQPASGMANLPPGFPVRKKDGRFACVGCHQPHGSENQMLWNANETMFCSGCHRI